MSVDYILFPAAILINGTSSEIYINDINAIDSGFNMESIRDEFMTNTKRKILTNESVKVRFDFEGQKLDFSTFDGVSVRVPFHDHTVAPNKDDGGGH